MIRIIRTAQNTKERLKDLPPLKFGAKSAAQASITVDLGRTFD